jgi:arabinan endo-1,5-alpha-L-arabinosidase
VRFPVILITMNRQFPFLVAAAFALAAPVLVAETMHRSQIRIRDPFVLPDAATGAYLIYSSTDWGSEEARKRKAVIVYRSKDLENWETPIPVFEVPEGHWARESIWAPEVHRFAGKYYLFVTLTSKDLLPTPPGRPQNRKRGTEILVADRPEGPFRSLANRSQTPEGWMSLDGTLWVEDGIPYMVFCHEWIQITDGSMELVRLKDDLSAPLGAPKTLFHATDAHWTRCRADLGELFEGKRYHASITDGPWLHRTTSGKLIMLWSSYGPTKYATGIAVSTSGKVGGPWEQQPETLWLEDGGHPMLFNTFDGRLVMTLHQPNRRVERARFFEMEDTGDTIRIRREIADFSALVR